MKWTVVKPYTTWNTRAKGIGFTLNITISNKFVLDCDRNHEGLIYLRSTIDTYIIREAKEAASQAIDVFMAHGKI